MSPITIEQQLSPNYKKGRQGRKIVAIVNHITAGLMPGTLSWLLNPQAKTSAHYLITKSGRVIQLVADEDTAFAVGNVNRPDWPLYDGSNPNYYTLSIEHEALAGESLTELQYQASLALHRLLISKWQIPVDRDHIIGHNRLDSVNRKNDPGVNFPWERLFYDLKKQPTEQQSELPVVNVDVDGTLINGFIANNRAYAPVREVFAALGRPVSWDAETNTVHVSAVTQDPLSAYEPIKIVIGKAVLNGFLLEDSSYASVRAVCEALGHTVRWEESTKTVTID